MTNDHKALALSARDSIGGNLQALLYVGEQIARVAEALEKTPDPAQAYTEIRVNDVKAAEEALATFDAQQALRYVGAALDAEDEAETLRRNIRVAEAAVAYAQQTGSNLNRREAHHKLQEAQKAYVNALGDFGKFGR